MPSCNIIEKIWNAHIVSQQPGHPAILGIDLQLLHEVTSSQAFQMLRERGLPVAQPGRCMATLDHAVPTRKNRRIILDSSAKTQVATLRQNAEEYGIPLRDFDSGEQGIVHIIGPEMGLTQPGMTIVCGDSHTATHGAFGALAFGIGTTEVGLVLATGCLLQRRPKTMRVTIDGGLSPGVFAKDVILALIAQIGVGGGRGHILEYAGSAVRAMSMDERMTICNMSVECGARAGLVSPDETTFAYIHGRKYAPDSENWNRAVASWKTLQSDESACFDKEISLDISSLKPMVTWGTNPGQGIEINSSIPRKIDGTEEEWKNMEQALEYVRLKEGDMIEGVPIQWAFLGSCTNARLPDLRIAAKILKGRTIAKGIRMLVVPGSERVKAAAEAEGLDAIFTAAGAEWRNPGCSACLGMNDDKVPPGARCISSSNRNFIGRQGPGSITHLASPATVAASAIAGAITSPAQYF